jgi:hypothetical protein
MYTYFSLRSLAKSNGLIVDLYKPHYNIATIAGSTLGYKHSQESLEKMRNIILSHEVRKRKILSTVNASIANRLPISVKNIITNDVTNYTSMTEAGKTLGV